MSWILGRETTYTGKSHRWMTGLKVKVVAVIRGEEGLFRNDADLAQAGGLQAGDMFEVVPWVKEEGRYSWVTSNADANELGLTVTSWH